MLSTNDETLEDLLSGFEPPLDFTYRSETDAYRLIQKVEDDPFLAESLFANDNTSAVVRRFCLFRVPEGGVRSCDCTRLFIKFMLSVFKVCF